MGRAVQDYIDKALRPVLEKYITKELPPGTEIVALHPSSEMIIVVIDVPHKFKMDD